MDYFMPTSLEEAVQILTGHRVAIIAGGTDLYPAAGERGPQMPLLDVSRLDDLRGINRTDGGWRIGATATWTDILRSPLPRSFTGLRAAAASLGAQQIQNAGTIGGNLCNASPAADGVPPLLALDAEVELVGSTGTRRLKLGEFITGVRRTALQSDELLTAVLVPDAPDGAAGSFVKHGSRSHLVISIAMVSALVWLDDRDKIAGARIAAGSCSPVAQRLPALEQALTGMPVPDLHALDLTPEQLAPLSPIGDMRGSVGYRMQAAATLCRRALMAAAQAKV